MLGIKGLADVRFGGELGVEDSESRIGIVKLAKEVNDEAFLLLLCWKAKEL